ncbi:MAG: imidazolonepropionase [Clostridiales bacterium]|nr:imidazolonepropionase [Clostridiales bacterium]
MLLIKNIGILQTPIGKNSLCGSKQAQNLKLYNAAILIEGGKIVEIYKDGELPDLSGRADCQVLDGQNCLVTPGLVDCHTHMVFGGWRHNEIPLKLRGATYLDILKAGGGILDTVRHTRQMSEDELYEKSKEFAREMLLGGVTTVESKSGYGLNLDDELKQLRVNKRLNEQTPMDVVSTFLGAHAIPPEYKDKPDEYIDYLCDVVLPEVKRQNLAEFCDVFCEDSVFDVEQSKKMLLCAQKYGMGCKIHADEIEAIGGAVLAGQLGAISAEHLIATNGQGIDSMAKGGVTAALLPATSFYLNKTYAPARQMIEKGIPVAIASDFNPGSCPSLNLQFAINLGYLKYRMLPEEILTATTLNAACAINRGQTIGSIEVGKQADLVIWNAPNFEMICYRFGSNQVKTVIKKGEIIQ